MFRTNFIKPFWSVKRYRILTSYICNPNIDTISSGNINAEYAGMQQAMNPLVCKHNDSMLITEPYSKLIQIIKELKKSHMGTTS